MSCYLETGQTTCHDPDGEQIPCQGSGQDAEFARGLAWPSPRFEAGGETAVDRLTGLTWTLDANPVELPLDWRAALGFIDQTNRERAHGFDDWRMPSRKDLRSLIDAAAINSDMPGT